MKKISKLFFMLLLVFVVVWPARSAPVSYMMRYTWSPSEKSADSAAPAVPFSPNRLNEPRLALATQSLLPRYAVEESDSTFFTPRSKEQKKSTGNFKQARHYLYDRFITDSIRSTGTAAKKPVFLPSPFMSYAPETDLQFGALALYSFYTANDSITRVSTQSASIMYTLLRQYKFEMDPDLWTRGNRMHFTGTFIYQSIPLNYYGIGYHTADTDQQVLASKQIFLDAEAEKEVLPNFRLGLTLVYQSFNFNLTDNAEFLDSTRTLYAAKGGQALFAGVSLIYDSRNFLNSTTHGTYLRLNTAYAPSLTGQLNPLVNFNLQASTFFSLGKRNVIGFNTSAIGMYGRQVPFYLLPQLGGSSMLRGYYTGRFRDKNALQIQTEYRYRPIPRIELAAFGGAGTVFGYEPYRSSEIKENFGGGVRYFFDLASRLSVRLDYGFGEKPPGEQRIRGFYFQFGEAF